MYVSFINKIDIVKLHTESMIVECDLCKVLFIIIITKIL